MRIILFIIQKEFRQIFRNKAMLPIIFILPLVQLLILANAATYEIKNIRFSYVDHDHSPSSRALAQKFEASEYFEVVNQFQTKKQADAEMLRGDVDVILEIPQDFERQLTTQQAVSLAVTINAIDGAIAGVENVYITQIIRNFSKEIRLEVQPYSKPGQKIMNIESIPSFWYNQTLNYKIFMVPGILVILVTMITLFLSGMNIVREKEIGTLEQINVTPIKKYQFIIGKLFPFWILGLVLLSVGLTIGLLIFNVPVVGSIFLIYFFTSFYLLVVLGMGLFISNFTETQQQAMFISWFFVVIFVLMSGLFTPIESMPKWAQLTTDFNPVKYFVQVMRMVMLKGSDLSDIFPQLLRIMIFAVVMNGLAVWSYKKVK